MKYLKLIISQVALVTIILIGYSFWKYPYFRENIATFIKLSTTNIPEPLTELYFEKHLELPNTIVDNERVDFSFTIHNLEHSSVKYLYLIYVEDDKGKKVIEKGEVSINHEDYSTINIALPSLDNVRTKVVVQLSGITTQQISFWMEPRQW